MGKIDREKVLTGLEYCQGVCGTCCPYWNGSMTDGSCIVKLHADTLSLLKEQQKLIDDAPHWIFGNSYGHAWMKCSNCCVSQSGQTACWSYCPNCGARMKGQVMWE